MNALIPALPLSRASSAVSIRAPRETASVIARGASLADVIGRVNEFLAGHRRDSRSLAAPISRRREIKHTFSHERDELRSRRDTCSLLCRVIDFTAGRFYFALCRAE